MSDDELCVVFCSQDTANKLIGLDTNIQDACIVWSRISDDTAVVVSEKDLIKWLDENAIE